MEGGFHIFNLALRDQPVGNQTFGIKLQRGLLAADAGVHRGVGEHRLVAFVMAKAAITEDIKHGVLVEFLAVFDGDAGGVNHCLRIVTVHMENRCFDHKGDVGRIGGRAAERRGCGETDLVVHDDMDGAPGAVAHQPRQAKAFGNHALAREGGIAVQQQGQNLGAVFVGQHFLFGAHFAEDDRIDRLKVAGVRGEAKVNRIAVEGSVRRCAEVVFHITRSINIFGFIAAALEFVENGAVGFHHDVGEDA